MNSLKTLLGFDTSDKAKTRLHVLEVFYKTGWKGVSTAFPNLSRPTLYRWKKEFEKNKKKLNSLVPKSTRPDHVRVMQTDERIVALIKQLREQYPRMGKAKIKRFTDAFCEEEKITALAESTIGKVIKRHNMFYAGKKKDTSKRRRMSDAERIRFCPKAIDNKPGYLQVDGVKFFYIDQYYYFLTGVDIVSKQAWLKLVKSFSSRNAKTFLEEILKTSYYAIHSVQTDNGSEFKSVFDQVVQDIAITRLLSYPRHPKTNGFVERFNWTIQDEFLHQYEDLLLHPKAFQDKLQEWLVYYNTIRPHQHLNYKTPLEFAKENGGIVSYVCD
jgi:transposase InsO family protein